MSFKPAPLIDDEFVGQPPTKRSLAHLLTKREQKRNIAGVYCTYAPVELFHAMGIVPATLCSFANGPIELAETVLPANLCPLVKSSYGFIIGDTCPFFGVSDAVVAETTCDGKKKMFELITEHKPLFVMDLPQIPDSPEALDNWTRSIHKLAAFFQKQFGTTVDDERLEAAIKDSNRKTRMLQQVFDYAALRPSVVGWNELYDILFLAQVTTGAELAPTVTRALAELERRKEAGYSRGRADAPRVMVTGCPIAGDAAKVFKLIEEAGGVVVALDECLGMKLYMDEVEEGTGDPWRAIAAKYLKIPCSCMTPNDIRVDKMDAIIQRFKPDAVVDVILHACHAYNVESHKIELHVQEKHGLPFTKIVTDYSDNDAGQIRTRMEALIETC